MIFLPSLFVVLSLLLAYDRSLVVAWVDDESLFCLFRIIVCDAPSPGVGGQIRRKQDGDGRQGSKVLLDRLFIAV